MLDDIARLKRLGASVAASDVLWLLEREVVARLEFEDALRRYLERTGAEPFAAAAALGEFLSRDLRAEGARDAEPYTSYESDPQDYV